MTDFTYSRVAALNFTTVPLTVGRSATGSVYAIGDTTFTTPLNVTMVIGGIVTTTISSDANGFFPDFTVANRTSVVFKQAGTSFTSVLTTTDPVPGAQGATGATGAAGAKGDRGDLASWQATTFYPLNQVISNPVGDLVKVTTAHTSTGSYDATKFDYVVPPTLTPAALNATYAPLWKATTAYLAGDTVQGPAGLVVTARANFTSGASYSPANWWVIHSDTLYVSAAELTGLADVTPSLRAASDYCIANGIKRLHLPPGTFEYRSRWFLNVGTTGTGIEVIGHGEQTTFRHTGGTADLAFIHALGTDSAKVATTVDILAGATSATIPSAVASTLAPGSCIGLECETLVFDVNNEAGMQTYASEIHRVASVSGTTVTFADPIIWPHTTAASAVAWKMSPVTGIKLRNFVITSSDPLVNKWKAIQIAKATNITVSGVTCRDAGGGIFFYDVIGGVIEKVDADRLPNYSNFLGYGTAICGRSANILIDRPTGRGTRHIVTSLSDERTGVFWGGPRHVTVRDGVGEAFPGSFSVWDTHPQAYDWTFENCHASGGVAGSGDSCGFQIRGIKVQIINGVARNMGAAGIRHHTMADNLDVIGGEYSGCQTFGISLNASGRVNGAWIHDNGTTGVILDARAAKARVMNSRIEENAKVSTGYGIHDQTVGTQNGNVIGPGNIIPKAASGQTIALLSPKNDLVYYNNVARGYGVGNDGVGGTIGAGVVRSRNDVDGIADATAMQVDFCSTVGSNPAVAALSSAASAVIGTANTGIVMPVKPHRSITLAVLEWFAGTTAAGNYDIAVLDSTGARLWSKGSTAWPTASTTVTETVSPTVALIAGQTYYIVLAADNTTATYKGLNVSSNLLKLVTGSPHARTVGTIFPIPSSVTLGSTATGKLPVVMLRES